MLPLVLIPGMMCDARMWGAPGELGRRLVVHAACTEYDTMQTLASAILADAPRRFALAGLSMGGIVAMEMLRQAPERIERLALLDTNPFAEQPEARARRQGQIDRALGGALASVMRDEMKPNYLAPGPGNIPVLDLCLAMALALGPEVFARQSRALRDRSDQSETLRSFRGAALVLLGRHDSLCPLQRHEAMQAMMPQARLAVIEGAGHLPTLEQPAATWAELARWLEA